MNPFSFKRIKKIRPRVFTWFIAYITVSGAAYAHTLPLPGVRALAYRQSQARARLEALVIVVYNSL